MWGMGPAVNMSLVDQARTDQASGQLLVGATSLLVLLVGATSLLMLIRDAVSAVQLRIHSNVLKSYFFFQH